MQHSIRLAPIFSSSHYLFLANFTTYPNLRHFTLLSSCARLISNYQENSPLAITSSSTSRKYDMKVTGYIEKDPESGMYIAVVPSIPGAHTQAESLDELLINLKEVVELCLDELSPEEIKAFPEFIGLQQLEVKT
jgi:predicted RNase H-like HicB family nuclease